MGTSKLLMGATIATVVILAIVLGLILVLLAELYCSLLLRRLRKRKNTAIPATIATATVEQPQQRSTPSLSTFYSHGVIRAPRNFLYPTISNTTELSDLEKQAPQSPISRHSSSQFVPVFSRYPWEIEEHQEEVSLPYASTSTCLDGEQLVYISNPIYNNEVIKLISMADNSNDNTPFETPITSPSRLETGEFSPMSSSSSPTVLISTPPLTPMKSIPAQVESSSISLQDVRSLCTTGSDSNSNNNDGISSSSSDSPRTSPSW